MSLGLWGRLVVVGIGCSTVLLAVIVVSFFVSPCCWGYRFLERVSKKKKNSLEEGIKLENGFSKKSGAPKVGHVDWLSKGDYVVYQTGSDVPEKVKDGKTGVYQTNDTNLKFVPFSVTPGAGEKAKPAGSTLKIKLSYKLLNSDTTMGRLAVHLMEANSLPYREYLSSLEPYVVLDIVNGRWSFQKTEKVVQSVQSRVVRHTYNPKFDQTFFFDVKKSEMKDWCLRFTLFDKDRMAGRTPIGEKRIYVKELKTLTTEPEVELVTELQKISRNQGELLFGISYLPTAQRLSVSIMKAARLKFLDVVQSLSEFYPYVRVLMLNSQGKCVKKKKTAFRVGEESPTFNETLAFDLPASNLEQVVFLLVLCSKILGKRSSTDGSATDAETGDLQAKDGKDAVLGAIVIGRNVRCSKARDHWLMVMQNPRKIISVWHHFR